MGTRSLLSLFAVLLVIVFVGCARDESIVSPDPTPPPVVDTLELEDIRVEMMALFDHYARVEVDLTDGDAVRAATASYIESRFQDDPVGRAAAYEALRAGPSTAEVPASLAALSAEFDAVVRDATSTDDVRNWITSTRLRRSVSDDDPSRAWLDVVARAVDLAPEIRDDDLARKFNLAKCMLSVFGGGATGTVAGTGVGASVGTVAAPGPGTLVGGIIGGVVGGLGGAATGAALGCF